MYATRTKALKCTTEEHFSEKHQSTTALLPPKDTSRHSTLTCAPVQVIVPLHVHVLRVTRAERRTAHSVGPFASLPNGGGVPQRGQWGRCSFLERRE